MPLAKDATEKDFEFLLEQFRVVMKERTELYTALGVEVPWGHAEAMRRVGDLREAEENCHCCGMPYCECNEFEFEYEGD
jgi:hypothetical protein